MPGVSKISIQEEFIINEKNHKRKSKQESQKIRQKFNKQRNKCTKIIARKKYHQKKNRRSGGRIKLKIDTTALTTEYSNDCIQEFLEKDGILPSICDNDYFGYNSEPNIEILFHSANAYKFIIDDIWINNIVFFLDVYDLLSLTQTCCDLNKLLTTNIIQNVYWKMKCGVLLNTSFIARNNSNNKNNSTNKNGECETFHQCFEPFNNDWKQFYIEIKKVLNEFRYYKDVNERSNDHEENLERLICRRGSSFLFKSFEECHMQMIKFLLDMNVILVKRDELKSSSKKRNGVSVNKISFEGLNAFSRFVFSGRDDYGMLKLVLNHETMLYKDPKTLMYPIESQSIIAIICHGGPRLWQIFFSKEFNLSIRHNIFDPSDENHVYDIGWDRILKGGLLDLVCQLWTRHLFVNRFKCLLSCKDMDLSNQINEKIFFHLANNYDLESDALVKIFRFLLARTCDWDNNNNTNGNNFDSCSDSEYTVRDIYADKFSSIDIIHTRDKNGNSLFYQCTKQVTKKVDVLEFLYDYAIKMNQQFGEKYCQNDIYYFINNINPKIFINKGDDKCNHNNAYGVINFDQFDGDYFDGEGSRYSTFMLACVKGYHKKMQFLIDYCQQFIDLTLRGWYTTKKKYVYGSHLALIHKRNWCRCYSPEFRDADRGMISDDMLKLVKEIEKGYQYYGMEKCVAISFNCNFCVA